MRLQSTRELAMKLELKITLRDDSNLFVWQVHDKYGLVASGFTHHKTKKQAEDDFRLVQAAIAKIK
jgi:hypothetical protein